MNKMLVTAAVAALLSACAQTAEDGNQALAEANSSGNEATQAVENDVAAAPATPLQKEQALALMKERHENYEKIGKAMRAAKKGLDSGDAAAVKTAAATINELAPKAESWFPPGTGPDIGKTEAKSEIWKQPEQFAAGMRDFRQAAAAFQQAASGSDLSAMKAAHADLGKTCKSCHDRFREEH
ncbi:c-type cytochrome [Sphingomonas sp. GCM10030256]|uniref:c-type cytochrome n=1 Tax=Sphingomonas sp. GCM10030256 TaxID=3273427 RepID=UPI00361179DA